MFLFALLFSLFPFHHAIYVSVTEVKPAGQGQWEISCRLFNNDLEDAIYNQSGNRVSLRTTADIEKEAVLIAGYVNSRFAVAFEGEKAGKLRWLKGSAENDSVWAYFATAGGKVVQIDNNLLTELFPTQQNVVTLEKEGKKSYFRFSADETTQAVPD